MKKDFLYTQLQELPYFRTLLRAVEASYYHNLLEANGAKIPFPDGTLVILK